MPTLRLIAWNCHHGSLSTRLAELEPSAPTLVFLQECRSTGTSSCRSEALSAIGPFVTRGVNATKAIALGSLDRAYQVSKLRRRAQSGRAVVGATVSGPVCFTALGIWSQGPRYVEDVMRTLEAYDRVLRSGPAVVMGDLNSGTNLSTRQTPSKGHSRIVDALADLGLVSAYHAFHNIAHGQETHPTYRHQHNPSKPWHIDFCFVPVGWARQLVAVDVFDGKEWAERSDHLPLKVDVRF